MKRKPKPPTELEILQARWLAKTKEPMPRWVELLPIEEAQRAVELTESGYSVAPGVKAIRDTSDGIGYGDSMREWDCDSYV